jgi:serine/threonine protein kinase
MSGTTSQIPVTGTVDPDLEAGQQVGEYRVESKIGQGGFGAVFKATHPLIGKVVAIKVLSRKFSVDPEMVSRFVAEAKAVNQIRHRHIIDIFSFGQLEDGRAYYVMEYLDGEPLDALLDRDKVLPLATAMPILRAIARALDAAHGKGIAHRDLKPENVFLAKDEDGGYFPKLLDFGIAKLAAREDDPVARGHKTRTGIPIGTPPFMSPEQCRGKDVDHRTDYYAFGIVAYLMLTGVYPIDGDDYMTVLMRQINDEPVAPSTVNPELPHGIDDAIAWLMKKDPAARPPNLATAVRAMEQVAEDSGIAILRAPRSQPMDAASPRATPTGLTPPPIGMAATMPSDMAMALPKRRSRLPWLLGGLALVVAAAAPVWYFMGGHDEQPVARKEPPPPAPAVTPPAPAPAPAPVAVAVDAARERVTITLRGLPAGTDIALGDNVLGHAPDAIQLARSTQEVTLVLRHAGYAPLKQEIVPDQDRTLVLELQRAAKPGTARPHPQTTGSHDIEDPFAK